MALYRRKCHALLSSRRALPSAFPPGGIACPPVPPRRTATARHTGGRRPLPTRGCQSAGRTAPSYHSPLAEGSALRPPAGGYCLPPGAPRTKPLPPGAYRPPAGFMHKLSKCWLHDPIIAPRSCGGLRPPAGGYCLPPGPPASNRYRAAPTGPPAGFMRKLSKCYSHGPIIPRRPAGGNHRPGEFPLSRGRERGSGGEGAQRPAGGKRRASEFHLPGSLPASGERQGGVREGARG
jgi:hypothetical protein